MQTHKPALEALGAKIVAGSVDDEEHALRIARNLEFPVAFGMTRQDAATIGAWWGEQRAILQPAEFLIDADGKVLHSLYASGPVGRMAPEELVRQLTRLAEMEKKT